MAHLWIEVDGGQQPAWEVSPLKEKAYRISGDGRPLAVSAGEGGLPGAAGVLVRRGAGPADQWVLLAGAASRIGINGSPLVLGARVLRDRDEILTRGPSGTLRRYYYSAERMARVEPFPGAGQPVCCPRCKQLIEVGVPAVQCPQCGAWHHESTEASLPCWSYHSRCAALCDQPTAIGAGFRWTPEGL